MIEKQTIIDRIEITRNGTIQVRFATLIVEDGLELASAFHRTSIEPGADISKALAAVNANLALFGNAVLPDDEIARVASVAPVVQTDEVIKEFKEAAQSATRKGLSDAISQK